MTTLKSMRIFPILAALALLGPSSVIAQGDRTPKVKKEKAEGPIEPAELKRLFTSEEPLELTIATDLKPFVRTRERNSPLKAGTLTFKDSAGADQTLSIQLGTRGNFRLMARNCSFPPTRLVFDSTVKKTIFAGQKRLKLVTRCQKSEEFDQYILQEYNLYRVYNQLTPYSFHARLARVTFTDTQKKEEPVQMWAFMIEDNSDMAKRNASVMLNQKGALWDDVDPELLRTLSLFEYLIGNTDWSVGGLHNIELIRDGAMNIRTVAYDLDWSGVISARYARPDPKLPIRTVRERLHRGPCMSEADLATTAALFTARKDAIYALYTDLKPLDPNVAKRNLEYFDDFYKTLADKRRAKREILEQCQPKGN